MHKGQMVKSILVFSLALALVAMISTVVLAEEYCYFDDSECTDVLGEGWVCDLDLYECVEVDIDGIDSSSDDSKLSESDAESCSDLLDNDEDGFIDEEDPDCLDSDFDGVLDGADVCEGFDDNEDLNENAVADGCEETVDGVDSSITALDNRVSDIETSIDTVVTSIDSLVTSVDDLNTNVQLIATNQEQLEKNFETQVKTIENNVASGLAVLQEDIEFTQTELAGTKEEVAAAEAKASFFRTSSIVVILGIIVGALGFFLRTHRQEEEKELSDEVKNFITAQIKNGMNEATIVAALQKSGWKEHDAKWAFEHTTADNYNKFLKSQGKPAKELPKHKPSPQHYKNIAIISIISIIVLGAMLLFIKQSVGFAVYDQTGGATRSTNETINNETTSTNETNTEITYTSCTNSAECPFGLYCAESVCLYMSEIYDTQGSCSSKCNFEDIKVRTSDDEIHDLSPGDGSYTAVGAIEWNILQPDDFCLGDESTKVAFEISKKYDGAVISEEVILVDRGDTSNPITHPKINWLEFYLTVVGYTLSCS